MAAEPTKPGVIESFSGHLGSVYIAGNLAGGVGNYSGSVLGASIGTVKILGECQRRGQ